MAGGRDEPIISLSEQKEIAMRKFVIATDGSPASQEAVRYGIELAGEVGAVVHLVHIAPLSDWVAFPAPVPAVKLRHVLSDVDRDSLVNAAEFAREHGVTVTTELLSGDPVDEIVAYADTVDADLIVVGSRGHGALASAVLGSVSLGVLHESRRPVVVARGIHRSGGLERDGELVAGER